MVSYSELVDPCVRVRAMTCARVCIHRLLRYFAGLSSEFRITGADVADEGFVDFNDSFERYAWFLPSHLSVLCLGCGI